MGLNLATPILKMQSSGKGCDAGKRAVLASPKGWMQEMALGGSLASDAALVQRAVCSYTLFSSQDANSPVTLRTRKFLRNPLLQRRQCVLDVIHPARANVSKSELSEKLGEMYKTPAKQVQIFHMRTHFGGGRSTGFALIYDSEEAMKFEPKFRLIRKGMAEKGDRAGRKLRKERKNVSACLLCVQGMQGDLLTSKKPISTCRGPRRPEVPPRRRPAMPPRRSRAPLRRRLPRLSALVLFTTSSFAFFLRGRAHQIESSQDGVPGRSLRTLT